MGIEQERFVNKVDQELICCICANVFEDAAESPCRHVFCRECISRWLQEWNSCPTCRRPLRAQEMRPPLPLLNNIINKMQIRCNYSEQGCTTTVEYERLGIHVRSCPYGPNGMACENEGCRETFPRNEKERHEAECLYRTVVCTQLSNRGCGMEYKLNEAANHNCVESLKKLVDDLRGRVSSLEETVNELREGMQALQNAHPTNNHTLGPCTSASCTCQRNSNSEIISLISDDEEEGNEHQRSERPVYRLIDQTTPAWVWFGRNLEGSAIAGSSHMTVNQTQLDRQRRQSRFKSSASTSRTRSRSRSPVSNSTQRRRECSPSDTTFQGRRSRMSASPSQTQTFLSSVNTSTTTAGPNLGRTRGRTSRGQIVDTNTGQVNNEDNSDYNGHNSEFTSSEESSEIATSPRYSASGYSSSDDSYFYLGEAAEDWWLNASSLQVIISDSNNVSNSTSVGSFTTTFLPPSTYI